MSESVSGKLVRHLLEYRGLQEEYVCAAVHWQSSDTTVRIDRESIVQKKYGMYKKEKTGEEIR